MKGLYRRREPVVASSCVGPLGLDKGIDLARTTVVVAGLSVNHDARPDVTNSAGVPKIFTFHDRIYLYWDNNTIDRTVKPGRWLNLFSRGIELVAGRGADGKTRLWGAGSRNRPVLTDDPALTTLVSGPVANDPLFNTVAAVHGVYVDGDVIYALTAVGGSVHPHENPCVNPSGTSYGCYRTDLFVTRDPLGKPGQNGEGGGVLRDNELQRPLLPFNPGAYTRLFKDPTISDKSDNLFLLGAFYPPARTIEAPAMRLPNEGNVIEKGFWRFPVKLDALTFRRPVAGG